VQAAIASGGGSLVGSFYLRSLSCRRYGSATSPVRSNPRGALMLNAVVPPGGWLSVRVNGPYTPRNEARGLVLEVLPRVEERWRYAGVFNGGPGDCPRRSREGRGINIAVNTGTIATNARVVGRFALTIRSPS
jgi:hypothetical protein